MKHLIFSRYWQQQQNPLFLQKSLTAGSSHGNTSPKDEWPFLLPPELTDGLITTSWANWPTSMENRKRWRQITTYVTKETSKKKEWGNWLEEVRSVREKTDPHSKVMWRLTCKWLCWKCSFISKRLHAIFSVCILVPYPPAASLLYFSVATLPTPSSLLPH